MKVQLALFRNSSNQVIVQMGNDAGRFWADNCPDTYVRATQAVEVEFPEIPREKQAEAELARLERQEKEVRQQAALALAEIENRRAEWLSLPAPVVAD